jgi:nudix-type nucleoside diphosphatase (YffH/AdpP family)
MEMDGNRVQIVKEKLLYQGWSTLKQYIINYERSDGHLEPQTREIYNSGDGAAVLMFQPSARKILLIKQFRLPVLLNGHASGFILECPAGMLDCLDPQVAIIKEIEEETGYKIDKVDKIYEAFATPGAHMEKIYFFTAVYHTDQKKHLGGGDISEQEDIELIEFSYEDIELLLKNGSIIDAKTIILLQWAQLNLIK